MSRIRKLAMLVAALALVAAATVTTAAAPTGRATPQFKGKVVIGNISAATGIPLASPYAFQTLQAWAKDVNAKGGSTVSRSS